MGDPSAELKRILDELEENYCYPSFGIDDVASMLQEAFAAGVAAGRRQAADALRQAADSTRETYLRDAFHLAARIAEAAPAEPVEEDTER